jgi:hypothetical protein
MTPDEYMSPREKPPSKTSLAIEAAHWACTIFCMMLAVLAVCWAFSITAHKAPRTYDTGLDKQPLHARHRRQEVRAVSAHCAD